MIGRDIFFGNTTAEIIRIHFDGIEKSRGDISWDLYIIIEEIINDYGRTGSVHPVVDKTVFIIGIGAPLKSGKPHDGRAPDYDDWELNGDILFWDDVLDCSIELSSMGIRVSPESMDRQLKAANCDDRRALPYHKALLNGELPLTIGGGIGQSRLSMLLLGKAHIGEVQASVWDEDTIEICKKAGVILL